MTRASDTCTLDVPCSLKKHAAPPALTSDHELWWGKVSRSANSLELLNFRDSGPSEARVAGAPGRLDAAG